MGQALPPANRGFESRVGRRKRLPHLFHEVSRAAGPSQQTTKNDGLPHLGSRQFPDATKPQNVVASTRRDPAAERNAEAPVAAAPRATASHSSFTCRGEFLVIITPPIAYPLRAVACKILDSTGRGPFRVQTDRGRMARSILGEIRMVLVGCFIAPGVPDTRATAPRCALPLDLTGQPSARPSAVRRRLEPIHIHHGTITIVTDAGSSLACFSSPATRLAAHHQLDRNLHRDAPRRTRRSRKPQVSAAYRTSAAARAWPHADV